MFFIYTSRNDASTLYHAGSMISTAKLLSDIKTYTNPTGTGTAVSDYKLAYTLGNAPFSQLTSVQRCDGATPANCPRTGDVRLADGEYVVEPDRRGFYARRCRRVSLEQPILGPISTATVFRMAMLRTAIA